ncbi:D-glycerate dehydrogenase [Amylibacter sp. SFDW26]|uniref:2-hydroxyacid dehydrogenase n=1 Tax=Amylibacter sp. SFDW26 TaxID=2652722 RepID=UPI001261D755|nr:D-glycerate dehydrogenase [Amylibacter sp. SFDW26]KAB7615977.1 D-glycerate dehydrogenase [Amylibacter sp. SFDW26]
MSNKPKVLVTCRWPSAVEKRLVENYDVTMCDARVPISQSGFREAFSRFDAILPTVTDKITDEAFQLSNPTTKIVGNFGVGYSHINTDAAKAANIMVTNTPDVLSDCTADLTLTLMLMAARRAGEGERELRQGQWRGWQPTHLLGTRMTGKTLGIIGFGRIGQEVAKRAHYGFGMKVVFYNRSAINPEITIKTNAMQVSSVDELLKRSDFVSLHCPGGDGNKHMIGREQLELMKNDAFLINTARGEVIDEPALVDALKSNKIAGAGLDVFDGEPNISKEFFDCENAVLLPHLGSATRETREAMGFRVLDNLSDFFAGREPKDRVA